MLTDLKQFMSSDYLLGNLGYDPDDSAKRLGDGLYEQRLIQQAVVARTGQRFLDGLTSDEAMFKYLMNNAIASKQELNLALGFTLAAVNGDLELLATQDSEPTMSVFQSTYAADVSPPSRASSLPQGFGDYWSFMAMHMSISITPVFSS
nr:hypothetical protein [Pseudomonas sp. A-B-19]